MAMVSADALGLAAVLLGALLGATGGAKLLSPAPRLRGQALDTALERALGRLDRAVLALRLVGGVELLAGLALLAAPGAASGAAALALGLGFSGYLAWARATAPQSSCGCTAGDDAPIGVRAFSRAGLVAVGGAAVLAAATPWWSYAGAHPGWALSLLAPGAALVVAVHRDLRVPARRLRLRLLGHPLGGDPAAVPVEGSVELLERSLAWDTLNTVVRSGLLDHWEDADGWRFLRYSGLHESPAGVRAVSVVFALSARARLGGGDPVVRVAMVDAESGEVLPVPEAVGAG
ncbi:MauE/DoxX family redox-associated membrane protein [Streptomyces polyrhachis]|uniref:MauE/DoxX family redox-associated membrane protein n=1 Tax=Streptomyces polyrhachis TaxID=1282885 RepID=A0ABW2GJI9_9ACTN